MHEFPDRFAEQFCFGVTQHVAKCLIDKYEPALSILADDPGGCLTENGAETFFRFMQRCLGLQTFGDVEGCPTDQGRVAIRPGMGNLLTSE